MRTFCKSIALFLMFWFVPKPKSQTNVCGVGFSNPTPVKLPDLRIRRPQSNLLNVVPLIFILPAILIGCNNLSSAPPKNLYQDTRLLMDTTVNIKLFADSDKAAQSALNAAFAEMTRIDALMSFYSKNSELSKINRIASKKPVKVSPEIYNIIKDSMYYAKLSRGGFDLTVGELTKLWGFGTQSQKLPSKTALKNSLFLVGYELVKFNDDKLTVSLTKAGMSLDLGGIAKGYAMDRAMDIIKRHGITSALINAGGDILAAGYKSGGKNWRIGIQHPRKKDVIVKKMNIYNQAVVTSGDYERYFEQDGIRYHHILDSFTGMPARKCQSVTIISKDALSADALSTAVFVLGAKAGMRLIETLDHTEGLIIDAEGKLSASSGLN